MCWLVVIFVSLLCNFIQSFWLCWSSKYVQGKYALSVTWFHVVVDFSFVRSFISISIESTKWHLWSMHHTFGRMFVHSTHCKSAPSLCMIDWVNFFSLTPCLVSLGVKNRKITIVLHQQQRRRRQRQQQQQHLFFVDRVKLVWICVTI